MGSKLVVTDFDGTITRRDFYSCVVEQLLAPADLEPWHRYTRGEITHFEALRRIFSRIRADAAALDRVIHAMAIDPRLAAGIERLGRGGWEVVIVSNGCRWYIDRLLVQAGVDVPVHSNPGRYDPGSGLLMELPRDSPFFDPEVGISKRAVVQHHLEAGATVVFAGDGRPDVEPALLVPPERRFAREWLARRLEEAGQGYRSFERWSELALALVPD